MHLVELNCMFGAQLILDIGVDSAYLVSYLKSIHDLQLLHLYKTIKEFKLPILAKTTQSFKKQCNQSSPGFARRTCSLFYLIINNINLEMRNCGLTKYLLLACIMVSAVSTPSDVWNRIVRLDSSFLDQDYQLGIKGSDVYRGPFSLQIYQNATFTFVIEYSANTQPYVVTGKATPVEEFSIRGVSYRLHSSQLQGSASYQLSAGLKWNFTLAVKQRSINLKREKVVNQYSNWILLGIFGVVGFVLFPLCDRTRGRLMYNIKKRTHPILCWSILFKFCFFWACALVNCFFYTFNLPWYYIFFTGTFYLFSLSPSLPQAIYFLSGLQNQVKDYNWFQNLGGTFRCMAMSTIFLTIPLLTVAFIFISKGLLFFFLLSLPVLYQFVHSCNRRQYSFTGVLLYDLMLTVVLSGVALFLPSLNFTLLTWKQGIIFWNYYLGVLIIGFLLSGKIIKMQVVQEIHLAEESHIQPRFDSESERRQELPKLQSRQTLEQ